MSIYELDDDLVRAWLEGHPEGNFSSALKAQLPISVPSKVGAVVRTVGGIYVRVQEDSDELMEWSRSEEGPTGESYQERSTQWSSTDQLPRITKVLSEGVDL